MAYIGNIPAESFISFEKQVFTIVNSQTAYTLSHSVVNENDIRLVVNNVVQEPGSGKAYTASGTTLTLSAALVNGTDTMYCVFLGRAIQTVNPPNASVGSAQVADSLISGKTALGATPADTDELLISDAGTLKRVDYSYLKSSNTPSFLVKKTSSQAINDVTKTLVTWDAEEIDTDSAFASNKFTVPSGKAGKYFFSSVINLEDSALYSMNSYFYKNGTEYASSSYGNYSSSIYISPTLVNNIILDLSVGDYVEVYAQGNTSDSGTLNVFDNGASTLFSWFQGFKLN
jgi:hypothetical protein